jgi:hypothetical protein
MAETPIVDPPDGATPQRSQADRAALEQRWLTLTRETLPGIAKERGWPVDADHCFQRILIDNAVRGVWYHAITGRPAYRHASDAVLACAVELGEAAVAGEADLAELNRRSLAWRRKGRTPR